MTLWGYVADPLIFVANREVWESWTPADRKIVKDAAVEAGRQVIQMARKGLIAPDLSTISEIEKLGVNVVKLSAAEREVFVKATRKTYQKWSKSSGQDLVNKAEKAVAARKQ